MSEWKDPRTLIAIAGWGVAAGSFVFAVMTHLWSRRESRHDILSGVLRPMTRCAQSLMIANGARQKREQLVFSYSNRVEPDVVAHCESLLERYNEHNKTASEAFHDAELQLAAASFRFPRSLAQSIQKAQATLGELGRLVNAGIHHKVEVELAKYRDDHGKIVKFARGWEVAGPLELLRHRTKESEEPKPERKFEYDLTQDELDRILELFHKRATTEAQNTFIVHPPQVLIDDPSILQSDGVIESLADSVFTLVFQDGTTAILGLHELVAFTYQLCMVRIGVEEAFANIREDRPGPQKLEVSLTLCMRDLMRPEMVKLLLEKITFSDMASDGPVEPGGAANAPEGANFSTPPEAR